MKTSDAALSAFIARVEFDTNGGCWLWSGAPSMGYGVASFGGKNHKAHRVSWALHMGDMPPPETKVCHRCDTPVCVNPAHLFLGTQADNVADMMAKGRHRSVPMFGGENPMSVLTETQVWEIRELVYLGLFSQAEIARSYGVSPMTVSRIINQQTWPHVHRQWPFTPLPVYRQEEHACAA